MTSSDNDPFSGDLELVRIDLDTGHLTVLTANGLDERQPMVSALGDHLVYAQELDTLYENIPHVVVVGREHRRE